MIENDPSQSAAEPLVPLMKRHKEACQKAISAVLNANDAAELKSAVQASSKEADEGNG